MSGDNNTDAGIQQVGTAIDGRAAEHADANLVRVKALTWFGPEHERKVPDSEFTVTRQRAAELRANKLIEYVDTADEEVAIENEAQSAAQGVRMRRVGRKAI